MAFIRNPKRETYTIVDNYAIRDNRLSLKALGLLVKLLSLPDNWEFSENGLEKMFEKDGQTSIRTGIKELEEAGYLKRVRIRDAKGRIVNVEWNILEKPNCENHSLDIANWEKQPQLNTNIINTKEKNKDIYSSTFVADVDFSFNLLYRNIECAYLKVDKCSIPLIYIKDFYREFYEYLKEYGFPLPTASVDSIVNAIIQLEDKFQWSDEEHIKKYCEAKFDRGTIRTVNHYLDDGIFKVIDLRLLGSNSRYYGEL